MKTVFVFLVSAGLLPANLLINGSFETVSPPLAPGTGINLSGGDNTTLNGWTVVNAGCSPCIGVVNGIVTETLGPAVTYTPYDGQHFLDLLHLANGLNSGIEQTVALTAGNYQLSFALARGSQNHPSYSSTTFSAVQLLINGVSQGTFQNTGVNTADPNADFWTSHNFNFTVPVDQAVTIRFMHANPFGNHYAGFDAVVLESAVPEPETWAMVGLALVGLGLQRRRQ